MGEKRVLSVGVAKEALGSVSAHLEKESYAIEHTPTARSATTLLREIPFHLVVLAHPQVTLVVDDFLTSLRHRASESRDAKVLILTAEPKHRELQALRKHGVEVISKDAAALPDLTTKVLGGDPRIPIAIMARLEAELAYGTSIRICQSENLSVSGMLVRTEDTFPVGTLVRAQFSLPDSRDPVRVTARVVRLTGPGEIPGIALHFEKISGEHHRRLERHLATAGRGA